jgi:predicted enzyme related to lactoylglutathione lyase
MSMFKDVNVVSVNVKVWEGAKKFYAEVLEWPVAYCDDNVGWCEYGVDGATHVAINKWDSPDPMPVGGGATIVFSVDDAYKTTEMLRARGVRCDDVIQIPDVITYGSFYDPEGNRLQFASP